MVLYTLITTWPEPMTWQMLNWLKFFFAKIAGSYSGIRFTILLRRKLSYHLIQTYLPSTLFIIVSWLSFLVPPESVPGRMALCMTTLLTLTAMFSAVRYSALTCLFLEKHNTLPTLTICTLNMGNNSMHICNFYLTWKYVWFWLDLFCFFSLWQLNEWSQTFA